jgi:hypothetical protein
MHETVYRSSRGHGVLEDHLPLGERQIAGNQHAASLIPNLHGDKEETGRQLKTGTDDLPLDVAGSAYKKLTKTADPDRNDVSLSGTAEGVGTMSGGEAQNDGNSLSAGDLGTDKPRLSPDDTAKMRNGPGWIRTNVGLRQRVYSPSPLATRAPTHVCRCSFRSTRPFH